MLSRQLSIRSFVTCVRGRQQQTTIRLIAVNIHPPSSTSTMEHVRHIHSSHSPLFSSLRSGSCENPLIIYMYKSRHDPKINKCQGVSSTLLNGKQGKGEASREHRGKEKQYFTSNARKTSLFNLVSYKSVQCSVLNLRNILIYSNIVQSQIKRLVLIYFLLLL